MAKRVARTPNGKDATSAREDTAQQASPHPRLMELLLLVREAQDAFGRDLLEALQKPGSPRDRATTVLHAAVLHIETLWPAPRDEAQAAVLLRGLAAALDDLDRGTVTEVLTPAKVRNRPPASSAERGVSVHAALALHALVAAGEKPGAAASHVVRLLHQAGIAPSRLKSKTVENWRNRLNEGPKDSNAAELDEGVWKLKAEEVYAKFSAYPEAARAWAEEIIKHAASVNNWSDIRINPPT